MQAGISMERASGLWSDDRLTLFRQYGDLQCYVELKRRQEVPDSDRVSWDPGEFFPS